MNREDIALALAENRMQLAYDESSGEIVWLQKQKDDGEAEISSSEKMKGFKFAGDQSLPLEVQAQMMKILAQVAGYIAEHGLKKKEN